jgi:hypothetical protein
MSKLTLSVDPGVTRRAKAYAARRGTSVSSLVETYLDLVSQPAAGGEVPVTPVLGRLRAELEGLRVDEGSYRAYLRRKYR